MKKLILNQKKIFKKICHQKQTKKKLIEGRLKKNQLIIIFRLFLIFFSINAYSLEIIRDPIFENYFKDIQLKYNLPSANVYIVKQNEINAFVLGNSIYFTEGMIKKIKQEDVLKSIYFHEVGHIYHNH